MMDKAKAHQLIKQLEQHQQSQIECLRALFDLGVQGEAKEAVGAWEQETKSTTNEGTRIEISSTPSMSSASVLDGPSQEYRVQIPDEWATPWSNALLCQRIREREKEPGCGGGLRRSKWSRSSEVS